MEYTAQRKQRIKLSKRAKVILGKRLWNVFTYKPTITAILLGTVATAILCTLHSLVEYSPGFEAFYILPIWLSILLGRKRAGVATLVVVIVSLFVIDSTRGLAMDEIIRAGILRFTAYGTIMLFITYVSYELHRNYNNAVRDPLTKVLNRSAYETVGKDLFAKAKKQKKLLTVAMIDCDRFKEINDTYGHKFGDRVLQILAATLQQETRRSDYIFRMGGDEFFLMFYEIDRNVTERIIKRINKHFRRNLNAVGVDVTLSIGIATLNSHTKSLEELLERADNKMYARKEDRDSTRAAFLSS